MSISDELGLKKPITFLSHEALLNIYYTASCLKKRADDFFRPFGLTDVQFNLMMLLAHQSDEGGGLSQAQLSDMMLVNRANITGLIDRMENAGLVLRTADERDRRFNIIILTAKGKLLLAKIEPLYTKLIQETMGFLKPDQQEDLIGLLGKVREGMNND